MATTRKLIYPHPDVKGVYWLKSPKPWGLHETSGLGNNWSIDFMAHGGTPVYAVEASRIWRFSGHDPNQGTVGSVYGWSLYLHTNDGLIYYYTHLGDRVGNVGDKVRKGQLIGHVGHWPNDEGRSHTHLGCTHPMGSAASKKAIRNVAEAPKKKLPPAV